MNEQITPYEYHDGKLGVKVKFLVSDENKRHDKSFKFIKYRSLSHRLQSKTCTEQQLRAGSWFYDALVLFESLAPQWRSQIEHEYPKPKEQAKKGYFAKHYESDRKAFDFFCAYRFGENNERKLEPEVIEKYTYNASVLNAVIACKTNRKAYIKSLGTLEERVNIWESLSADVNAFREVAHDLPTTATTLRHKVTKYQKEGYDAIISKKYGTRNAASVKEDEQEAFIEMLLSKHQNLNNEQIANLYNEVAKVTGWKTIKAGVVAIKRKDLDLFVYAGQHGETNLMHQKQMQIKRSRPSAAMLYWSMDGWDAELLYQKTTIDSKGNSVTTYHNRLTVVMILDPFNDYIIGYAIGQKESTELIRQALKNALRHTEQLFGSKYKPYQLQTDHYQLKNLQPTYENTALHFTPAKVKNAKSKIIEQFFDKFNEKHFQAKLLPNWSGHNVTSSAENQVNDDYLAKIRHQFPDEYGCRMQIITAIENERAEKVEAYKQSFEAFAEKTQMSLSQYLRTFGKTTGYTNKMTGNGLTPTINGIERAYDSFDLTFRKYMHEDWMVFYDEDDFSRILVTNAQSRNGKLVKEIGTLEFILEEKYIQPMALYDQQKGDGKQRQLVYDFNKRMVNTIVERMGETYDKVNDLFQRTPELDTLRKLMIPDSTGQHKDHKSAERLAIEKVVKKQEKQEQKVIAAEWKETQENYLKEKVNINKYSAL